MKGWGRAPVIELLGTVGPLTDPTPHGAPAADAFDPVLPSLPGYGFSGQPTEVGWNAPGREGLRRPHLLPHRLGRPLRRLGAARTVRRRDTRDLPVAPLADRPRGAHRIAGFVPAPS
jgi:hypothetical protein